MTRIARAALFFALILSPAVLAGCRQQSGTGEADSPSDNLLARSRQATLPSDGMEMSGAGIRSMSTAVLDRTGAAESAAPLAECLRIASSAIGLPPASLVGSSVLAVPEDDMAVPREARGLAVRFARDLDFYATPGVPIDYAARIARIEEMERAGWRVERKDAEGRLISASGMTALPSDAYQLITRGNKQILSVRGGTTNLGFSVPPRVEFWQRGVNYELVSRGMPLDELLAIAEAMK